ncbi:arabinogalactan endo-1,4-beta-galactosidase, partial [Streptomyces sp. SID5475]|nr:arabinogalactan endo-1,4-beta-galactosidase [Streptomyces sp. SID5475]
HGAPAARKPGPAAAPLAVRGGDLSSLPKNEAFGASYRYEDGTAGDALAILRSAGMNYVRLKIWVDPADGYNDKDNVLAMARRAKAQGMKLLVDFHYSDAWADPGKQNKPAAWSSHGYEQLRRDVRDHTHDVLNALKAQGTTADMVQIGNEINGGMLWPEGSTDNWPQLAGLLKAGAEAAKSVSAGTRVVLHLAEGGDLEGTRWWFDRAVAHGVPFDVIGLSYYGYWHGTPADLRANLNASASRYGRPVLVAETAYAHTLRNDDALENIIARGDQLVPGYPATPEGQAAQLREVMAAVADVPDGRGLGVVYWEPAWTAVPGSGWDPADPGSGNAWENQALFGYDDRALPAVRLF